MFLTQRRAYFSFVIYTRQAQKENFTVKMLFKKNTDSVVMAMCAFTSVVYRALILLITHVLKLLKHYIAENLLFIV